MSRKKGMLQLLKGEIEAQVIPALNETGFVLDPARQQDADWDGQSYNWYFVARPDNSFIVQLWVFTGVSRDPGIQCHWEGFLLNTEGMEIAEAASRMHQFIETTGGFGFPSTMRGEHAISTIHLSPYHQWTAPGLGLLNDFDAVLPEKKHLRLIGLCIFFPPFLLLSVMLLPMNFLAIFLDFKWLKSEAARSGKRQKKIAAVFARKVKHLPARLDRLREKAEAAD